MKITLSIITFLMFSCLVFSQVTEKRVALVIGNSEYQFGGALTYPKQDAQTMKTVLQELGFEVIYLIDATQMDMRNNFIKFIRKIENAKISLIYYSGHGIQIDGVNYLVPVDTKIDDKIVAQEMTININNWVSQLEGNEENLNIVILDACRNNPFKSWTKGSEKGLKQIDGPCGTIIAFATRSDNVAQDNGLYAKTLASEMRKPQQIEQVFKRTRKIIHDATEGQQTPMEWTQITGTYYLKKSASKVASLTSIAFTDDFQSNFNWMNDPNRLTTPKWYADGGYYFQNKTANMEVFYPLSKAGWYRPPIRIEISATLMEGAFNYPFGILFGSSDTTFRKCCSFGIYGDGRYSLYKYINNIGSLLVKDKNANIYTGYRSEQRIMIEIRSDNIRCFVNGTFIGEYQSDYLSDYLTGYIGLCVGYSGMKVFYDNLRITYLPK